MGRGKPSPPPSPPVLFTHLVYPSHLLGTGHAGLAVPGPHWQRAVAGDGIRALLSAWETSSGQAPSRPRYPPSYLSVFNQEAGAMAVGAFRALPAACAADAAHTTLAAHAIPVACCGRGEGRSTKVRVGTANG